MVNGLAGVKLGNETTAVMDVSLIADLRTSYPADVLLFHPHDASVFFVGTYLLDEETRVRHGKIYNATLINEIQCDAILDMKWYQSSLYVAHSTGSLSVYAYPTPMDTGASLVLKDRKSVLEAEVLIMSLSVTSHGILTSNSDGSVSTFSSDLQLLSRWTVSDLEVWIQARSEDGNIIYSGSDDGVFLSWDVRAAEQSREPTPVFRNRRTHGAGVTAILPYQDARTILTGSYDDHIRRFDLRSPNRAIQEENLGGGVWRIIPRTNNQLVACCMYEGAKVIGDKDFQVIKEWKAHESMVYGGDVAVDLIGTCSFYDKRVCIWS